MTLVSRIFGLWRDLLLAKFFGATALTDAFFIAFRMPNFLRRLLAEGAFSQSFVPVLNYYREKYPGEVRALIEKVATLLLVVLTLLTIAGIIFAPVLVYLWAPGFAADPEKFRLTVFMVRITFPYIFFIALTAFATAVLNTWEKFSLAAFAPTLLNLSFIGMMYFFRETFSPSVVVLAWSVPLGGLLQLLAVFYGLHRLRLLPHWNWQPKHEGLRRMFRLMGPIALGTSAAQLGQLLNSVFASFLVSGSVSWLYCAERLMEFPVGLLGAAMSTIMLPALSQAKAQGLGSEQLLHWSLRMTFVVALPVALMMLFFATPLVAAVFYRGAFNAEDTRQTAYALMAYGVGITPLLLVKVLAPAFYARMDVKTPLRASLWSLGLSVCVNLLLIGWLKHVGLALAISLGSWCNVALLYRGWLKKNGEPLHGEARAFIKRLLPALVVLSIVFYWGAGPNESWLNETSFTRIQRLALILIAAGITYVATMWLSGFRWRDFSGKIKTPTL